MKNKILLVSVLLVAGLNTAWGWGQKGHRIIAQVAYMNMTSKAKKNVDKVLGKNGLVYWVNWPDEIKSDTIYPTSYDWHFQNLQSGLPDDQVVSMMTNYAPEGGNLFRVTDSLRTRLQADRTEEHNLRFFAHFIGDRFCPMHLAHAEDKGGNRVKMKWFGKNTNLHSVWDSEVIESKGYTYTEYAQILCDQYGNQKDSILSISAEELVLRNYHMMESIYEYQDTFDGNSYHYVYRWSLPCEWQLYAAGLILARELNALYK